MAVYLYCLYSDEDRLEWFQDAWQKTGRKLDMGKSCVRFKKIEDVPLDVIGKAVKRVPVTKFIAHYEAATQPAARRATRPIRKK